MSKRLWIGIGAAGMAAVAFGAWLGLSGAPPRMNAADTEQVRLGQTVYAAHCADCHGTRLEGQPNWKDRLPSGRLPAPPHDASGHTWHHSDAVLFRIVKEGIASVAPPGYESDMPAYAGVLSDREIAAVLSFIKAQWPEEIRVRQEAISRQAGG
jgi:mono/diheme cytochrome c family protein